MGKNMMKKGAWKRWLSTALAVTMVAGVGMPDEVYAGVNGSDSVPEGYTSDENGLMAYRYTSGVASGDAIDIMGYVEGKWRETTYDNEGNVVILKIGDEIIPVEKIDGSAPIKEGVELYVKVTPSFVSDGQLIKLTYTVENKGSSEVDYSIAGYADAQFAGNDDCPIVNVGEVKNGSAFALNNTVDDKTISFAVFPQSASTSNYFEYDVYQNYFVDGINGYWEYYDEDEDEDKLVTKNLKQEGLDGEDSGYSFAWNNQTLGGGESKSYSALFGVGDLENIKDAVGEATPHTHTYGDYKSNNDATKTSDGTKSRTCTGCGQVETVTDVGSKLPADGAVAVPTEKENGNFAAGGIVNSPEEIKVAVLTAEDKAAIAAGKDVNVWLEVADNSAKVSEADKKVITAKLPNNYTVGTYLDINLWKQITDSDATKVTKVPNGKVKISLAIPKALQKNGRSYKIIRNHEGVATVLDANVDANYNLTFETDKFSTYALVYSDNTVASPKTGDVNTTTFLLAMMVGLGIISVSVLNRKKNA